MRILVLWTIFNSFIIGFKFQSNSTISSSTKNAAASNTFSSTSIALICVFVIGFFLILLILAILIKRKKIRSYFIQKCRKEIKNTSTSKQNVGIYLTQFENEDQNEKPNNNSNQYDVMNSIILSPKNLTIEAEEHVYDFISDIQTKDFYDSKT